MRKTIVRFALVGVVAIAGSAAVGCAQKPTPTTISSVTAVQTTEPVPTDEPTLVASATPDPSTTAAPQATETPDVRILPTADEVAPEAIFVSVGSVAMLSGDHAVSGKAIVAGLQTMILQRFSYDGLGSGVDIRLVLGDDYDNPAAVLIELEARPYVDEMIVLSIPASAAPGTADRIVVYSADEAAAYAESTFD